jgi:hypothetical protein
VGQGRAGDRLAQAVAVGVVAVVLRVEHAGAVGLLLLGQIAAQAQVVELGAPGVAVEAGVQLGLRGQPVEGVVGVGGVVSAAAAAVGLVALQPVQVVVLVVGEQVGRGPADGGRAVGGRAGGGGHAVEAAHVVVPVLGDQAAGRDLLEQAALVCGRAQRDLLGVLLGRQLAQVGMVRPVPLAPPQGVPVGGDVVGVGPHVS